MNAGKIGRWSPRFWRNRMTAFVRRARLRVVSRFPEYQSLQWQLGIAERDATRNAEFANQVKRDIERISAFVAKGYFNDDPASNVVRCWIDLDRERLVDVVPHNVTEERFFYRLAEGMVRNLAREMMLRGPVRLSRQAERDEYIRKARGQEAREFLTWIDQQRSNSPIE